MASPDKKYHQYGSKCGALQGLIVACLLFGLLHQREKGVTTIAFPDSTFEKQDDSSKVSTITLPNTTAALRRMAAKLQPKKVVSSPSMTCPVKQFGTRAGRHWLCNYPPPKNETCWFYSFGISRDYSFDTDLADQWGCRGFAADPTIVHPSQLHPKVTFHSVGAKMLSKSPFPITTSMPSLMKWLNHEHISVLKMDCEGCEYSLGVDIANEDPHFFHKVDQFAVEVHVSKKWLNDQATLHALGLLYEYLEEAGLELQHYFIQHCSKADEATGCMEELDQMHYPCGHGKSCHNYLFARPPRIP